MELFTKVQVATSLNQIDYHSNLAFFGSCFADNISKHWINRKFKVLANPFGVIYNPLSIENQITKIVSSENCCTNAWNMWDYQGALTEQELSNAVNYARVFLRKSNVVFITLGTAFVYFLKETGKAVANCHKKPAELFERRLISVDEAATALRNICRQILHFVQNDVKIVFTVSPLRHMNDGAHGNNLSKATLHLAIEKVLQEFATVSYFPSYEIVMDELRDYRFYAEDMTHLSATAEDYIFERMCSAYCSDQTIAHIKYVEKFMKTVNHRIIDAGGNRTTEMAKQQIAKAENLEGLIDGLDLSEEKKYFAGLISG